MLLEIGTVIYHKDSSKVYGKYIVSRVTSTQAIVKTQNGSEIRFRRDVRDGSFFEPVSSDRWTHTYYAVETPEIKARFMRLKKEAKLKGIDFTTLTDEQLDQILLIAFPILVVAG
jgi:hypothetical protein